MSTNFNHYNLGHFLTPSLYAFPFHSILMEQFYIQYVLLITPTLSTIYNLKYVYPLSLFRVSIAQRYYFFYKPEKNFLTHFILETPKGIFGKKVQNQIRCHIMWHLIWASTILHFVQPFSNNNILTYLNTP